MLERGLHRAAHQVLASPHTQCVGAANWMPGRLVEEWLDGAALAMGSQQRLGDSQVERRGLGPDGRGSSGSSLQAKGHGVSLQVQTVVNADRPGFDLFL